MKHTSISKFAGALLCAAAISLSAHAETVVSTTTSAGTISSFTPGSQIVVKTEAAQPLTYSVSENVTYVDETGAPVSAEIVKSGLPVTVHYVKEGEKMVASKVVVRKSTTTTSSPVVEKRKTTTTTTTTGAEVED